MADGTRTVKLPALTTELETAELLEWLVGEGDEVREGDPLAEVTTDKVEMEVPSPYDGTVTELFQEVGAELAVGSDLVVMTTAAGAAFDLGLDDEDDDEDDDGAEVSAGADEPAQDQPAATSADAEATDPGDTGAADPTQVAAPPGVRRHAEERGVDLTTIEPSGSRGQVTLDDVEQAAGSPAAEDQRDTAETAADARDDTATDAPPRSPTTARATRDHAPTSKQEKRRAAVRRATARSTTRSQAIPQFTLFRRADLTDRAERRDGVSWTTIIAQAMAAALWRHPEVNARWDEEAERAVPLDHVAVGLAVDTPTGLVVTTLDDPDRMRGAEADQVLRAAAARAREGRLSPDEMRGATSTVSNLGGFGVERFTALLLPPQATILSVGTITKQPLVVDDEVVPRLVVELGLTVDHRVADGADGARFLATLVELLEQR